MPNRVQTLTVGLASSNGSRNSLGYPTVEYIFFSKINMSASKKKLSPEKVPPFMLSFSPGRILVCLERGRGGEEGLGPLFRFRGHGRTGSPGFDPAHICI